MTKPDTAQVGSSWNTYWHGTSDSGAFSDGGVSHPSIDEFWTDVFHVAKSAHVSPKILDIAAGNGAVVKAALQALGNKESDFTCVDVSSAAIRNIQQRYPGATGIVADATSIPLEDHCFEIVTSQFGIEYAGTTAVSEAARLVAPGGQLVLMLHIEHGSIYQECKDSLAAIERLQAARFVPLARRLFEAGFAAVRGAERAPYDSAGKAFSPAIRAAESIIGRYGEHVAGGTIATLYADVARIHGKMQNYDADEILSWLATMEQEIDDFRERMSSMMHAAVAPVAFDKITADLRGAGFTLDRAEPLRSKEQRLPLAWIVVAIRSLSGK